MKATLCAAAAVLGVWFAATADPGRPPEGPRRPVALALAPDGRWLYVANRQSGTVSVLDLDARRVAAEVAVGRQVSDFAMTPDGRRLLATDEAANELIVLSPDGPAVDVVRRVAVAASPVTVRVSPDGSRAFVAALWSRQVAVIDLASFAIHSIDLPFSPRLTLPLRDATLLVADAFGGRLAVVDAGRATVEAVHALPAHNVRGLALSHDGERIVLAHQTLQPETPATTDALHWGNLVTNNVRVLRAAEVLTAGGDPLRRSDLAQLGGPGAGAADPAGVAVAAGGRIVTALGGVGELAVGTEAVPDEHRLAVGRRPTALALDAAGRRAYVADTTGDAVAVVDVASRSAVATIPLGPPPEPGPAARGEAAFYDARLSRDGWLSCHSCHADGHTIGLRSDTMGDGSFGAPKRIPSLRGVGDTGPWLWDGSATDLEGQVRKSIRTTMHGKPPEDGVVRDLAAFLRALPPVPPATGVGEQVRRGRDVFREQGCVRCHAPPAYTSPGTFDVGLTDEVGRSQFNPPSLRGVGRGGPFFHDGRAATLADVFVRHKHQLKGQLPAGDLDDLLAFLRTL